jgi:hypothetical protein
MIAPKLRRIGGFEAAAALSGRRRRMLADGAADTQVFQADPLVCRHCGGPLEVAAYVTDALAIRQILELLDPPEKPPPDIRDIVRVPVDDEGRELDLQPA